MELTNGLTLKDRKKIKNTGELPGFTDGAFQVGQYSGYNPNTTYADVSKPTPQYPNNWRSPITQNVAPQQDNNPITNKGVTNITPNGDVRRNLNGPTQADSAAAGAGPWFAIGAWLGGGVAEGLAAKKSSDQLLADAGSTQGSIGGISYDRINDINSSEIMKDYDNSITTDFLTNPARGITKLFNRSSQRREAEKARNRQLWFNDITKSGALSDYLASRESLNNGNNGSQPLYAAVDGKPVYSAYGKINAPATARVSSGETIVEPDGSSFTIPGTPNFADGKLANVGNQTAILSNHGASQYYQSTGDLGGALVMDRMHRASQGKNYKNGKLPRFAEGWWGNAIPSAISSLASIGQILDAGRQKPYRPNIYSSNRYANNALSTLAGLRINPYHILPDVYNLYGRTANAINTSGGLSAGQRAAARIAAMTNTQQSAANALLQAQQQNNAYKANWAQMALNTGAQDAQRRMAANQFNEEYFAKSHAARQQGMQMGIYNLVNQMQNYYANDFKRRQFNDTMALYRDQNKLDWDKYNYWLKTDKRY